MNLCILSGRVSHVVMRGKDVKVLSFTLETRWTTGNGSEKKERTAQVPCVIFNPPENLHAQLAAAGEDTVVELEGRIQSSSFEINGDRRMYAEVVAFRHTVTVVKE